MNASLEAKKVTIFVLCNYIGVTCVFYNVIRTAHNNHIKLVRESTMQFYLYMIIVLHCHWIFIYLFAIIKIYFL